jgi:carboxypeptidase Taq
MKSYDQLRAHLSRIQDLNSAAAVLEWDLETYMPEGSAEARAQQIATLRQMAHEMLVADDTAELVSSAADATLGEDPQGTSAALARVVAEDVEKARRLPADLVAAMALAAARARQAWKEARENNTFATFAPHLERLLDLSKQQAHALGFEEHLYDALLDQYEPGMRTREVETVFRDLRRDLVSIVEAIAAAPPPDDSFLHAAYPTEAQWAFGMAVLRNVGYDFSRGRQDLSTHPFSTSFSVNDVRITTRVQEDFLPAALFGSLHEAGHALYEQGIDQDLDRTPLASGTSLGMHESQSRLWENQVGRSRPFWKHYYPRLQSAFPDQLGAVDLGAFYRAINRVAPSLIRVEADEVTYNLHIMVRFELELALLEGDLPVADLPAAWNDRMEQYLGLRPERDAEGVLQDIHWSLGAFGYFPTYALGNLMSTQLWDAARASLPSLEQDIGEGRFGVLLEWLRENVHRHGRKLKAPEILERVTGERLTARPWLAYVRSKFGDVYGVKL